MDFIIESETNKPISQQTLSLAGSRTNKINIIGVLVCFNSEPVSIEISTWNSKTDGYTCMCYVKKLRKYQDPGIINAGFTALQHGREP